MAVHTVAIWPPCVFVRPLNWCMYEALAGSVCVRDTDRAASVGHARANDREGKVEEFSPLYRGND
eukprot:162532-Chlamydomonas_euryale.AAC.3